MIIMIFELKKKIRNQTWSSESDKARNSAPVYVRKARASPGSFENKNNNNNNQLKKIEKVIF